MSTAGQAAARDSSADDLVVELEDYRIQIGQIKMRCEALVEGLGNEAFNWKPEEHRWSICECLGHLNITAELYLPLIDGALAKSRSQGLLADVPARRGLIGGWIVRLSEPPPKGRVKAPKVFRPQAGRPLDSVVCQGRSKFGPLRRSKSRPVGEGVAVFVGRLERSLRSPFRAAQA